jgi:hypothetical protein
MDVLSLGTINGLKVDAGASTPKYQTRNVISGFLCPSCADT